jgi:uncharacterized protein YjbI with pentapeptide repeats
MYQLTKDPRTDEVNGVCKDNKYGIPFDPANTDYANFKKEVLAGAELQDADGNVMTDASAYIGTLP